MNLGTLVVRIAAEMSRYKADMGDAAKTTEDAAKKIEQASGRASSASSRLGGSMAETAGSAAELLAAVGPAGIAIGAMAATIGVAALAAHEGAKEKREFEKAIVMTGNAAGVTSSQMAGMASSISKVVGTQGHAAEVLAQMAASGAVAGGNLEKFSTTAIQMERVVGQSVDNTAKIFAQLGEEPVKASLKLNQGLNYLTAATFEQILAAEKLGDTERAASIAQNAYSKEMDARTAKLKGNLGLLERAWQSLGDTAKKAWDKVLSIGREAGPEQELQAQRETVKMLEAQVAKGGLAVGQTQKLLDAARATLAVKEENARLDAKSAAWQADQVKAENEKIKKLAEKEPKGKKEGLSDADRGLKLYNDLVAQGIGLNADFAEKWDLLTAAQKEGKISLDELTKSQATLLSQQGFAKALAKEEADQRALEAKQDKEANAEYIKGLETQDKRIEKLQEEGAQERLKAASLGLTREAAAELAVVEMEAHAGFLERNAARRDGLGLQSEQTVKDLEEAKALRELAAAKRGTAAKQYDLDTDPVQKTLKDVDAYLDPAKAQSFGDALKDAFGGANDALVKLGSTFGKHLRMNAELVQLQEALAREKGLSPEKRIARENGFIKAQAEIQMEAYADMAGAAKGFFDKNSDGYRLLEGIEKAAHLVRMANMAEKLVTSMFLTSTEVAGNAATAASGVASDAAQIPTAMALAQTKALGSVANQGQGDPYSAFGRIAAMAAIMAGLGLLIGGVGGGGGHSESSDAFASLKANDGSGTVLGDSKAQSESIKNSLAALESMAKPELSFISQMVGLLKSINDGIAGTTNALLSSGFDLSGSGFVGSSSSSGGGIAGAIFGSSSSSTSLQDLGLAFVKQTVAEASHGVKANTYQVTRTDSSSSGFLGIGSSSSTSYNSSFGNLDSSVEAALTKVVNNMVNIVSAAGAKLGATPEQLAAMQSIDSGLGKVSLKDKTGAEVQEILGAVFGAMGDKMAAAVLPSIADFQKMGEGYLETLTRVAGGFEYAGAVTDKLGIKMVALGDVVNKQGDTAAELVRQSIVDQESTFKHVTSQMDLGNIFGHHIVAEVTSIVRDTTSGIGEIIQNFSGTADNLADLYTGLIDVRTALMAMGASADTVSAGLLKGAGGLDGLTGHLADFQIGFMSTGEQLAVKQTLMDAAFGKLDMETPKTAKAFHDLVLGLMAGGEASAETLGSVLALSGGMRDLLDTSDSYADELDATAQQIADAAQEMADRVNEALGGLADNRFGLENDLLGLQGNDGEVARRVRERDLKKLTEGITNQADIDRITAAYDYNKGLEAQIKTLQEAKKASEESARAQQQAADNASRAAEQIKNAWQSLTDSLFAEVARIRGMITGGSSTNQAQAESALYLAAAQASAGDQAAFKALPQLSQAFLTLAESNASSREEIDYLRGRTASLLEGIGMQKVAQYGLNIPKLDVGTNYIPKDGLFYLHEGEEVKPKAWNPAVAGVPSNSGSRDAAVALMLQRVAEEIAKSREQSSREALAIIRHTGRSADFLEDTNKVGMLTRPS